MGTQLAKWIDYIDESHWRFGLVLTGISVIPLGLFVLAVGLTVSK